MPQTSLYKLAAKLGFVQPYMTYRELRQMVSARFYGDLPRTKRHGLYQTNRFAPLEPSDHAGVPPHARENVISFPVFEHPKTNVKQAQNVLYTPQGFAWRGAVLDEEMSVRGVITNADFKRPLKAVDTLETGTLLQSEYNLTFADWICEQSKSMALAGTVPAPVVIPRFLYERPYVQGEFKRLGLAVHVIDKPTLVKEATVLIKPQPDLIWTWKDVDAYRRFHRLDPVQPKPGSLIYLSREGAKSEQSLVKRSYPSAMISEIVEELGGKVITTGDYGHEDFLALADTAETVIADHGAAMFNLLYWRSKSVIELVPDNWWDGCFVFLSAAVKVRLHETLNFSDLDKQALKARIEAHLAAVAALAPPK